MEPTFSGRVIALAFDVLVSDVRVVPAETGDFLFKTKPRVFRKHCVATLPEFAMLLNDPWHPVTRGFDHMFMHHFRVKRRQFPVPVHDLRRFVLIRTHMVKEPSTQIAPPPLPILEVSSAAPRSSNIISALTFLQPLGKAAGVANSTRQIGPPS